MLNRSLLTSLLLILVLNLHAQLPQWIVAGDSLSAGITHNMTLRGITVDNINRHGSDWDRFDIDGDSVDETVIICSPTFQPNRWNLNLRPDSPSYMVAPGGNALLAYHPGDTIHATATRILNSANIVTTYPNGAGAPQMDGWSPDSINYIGFLLENNGGWRLGWLQVQVVDLGAPGAYNYMKGIVVGAAYRDISVSVDEAVGPTILQIFPNPASASVQLNLPIGRHQGRFSLCNLHGQIVFEATYQSSSPSFDLSHLPGGMYIATCSDHKGQVLRSRLVLD